MTDTPTPQMTPEQRAHFCRLLNNAGLGECADQLEADGVTIATLTAERDGLIALAEDLSGGLFDANKERDAAQAEIARLTAALATAREDGLREAMQGCQAVANEAKSYSLPQMTVEANTCDAGGP